MERKNTNQCLGGLRVEYQGLQSPQTFLVKKFSFNRRKSITDRGFKAASWLP